MSSKNPPPPPKIKTLHSKNKKICPGDEKTYHSSLVTIFMASVYAMCGSLKGFRSLVSSGSPDLAVPGWDGGSAAVGDLKV